MLTTLSDPAFQGRPRDVKINEVGKIITEVFDFQELSRRTLGTNWKKLSAEQQTEFVEFEFIIDRIFGITYWLHGFYAR